MKRLMIACLLLYACAAPAQTGTKSKIVLEGDISAVTNAPALVQVTYRKIGGRYEFDSCVVKDGKFTFTKELDQPMIALFVNNKQRMDYYACYLLPGEAKMKSSGTFKNSVLTGTGASANADFTEFSDGENRYIQKRNAASRSFGKYDPANTANEKARQLVLDSLDGIRDEMLYKAFIMAHPASPVSLYALLQYAFNPPFEQRKDMNPVAIQQLLDGLPAGERKWPAFISLQEKLDYAKLTAIGNPAIDFSANDTLGHETRLSSFKGRYVLVDFWASWCAPCRAENPNVLAAYNRFKDKGFTVLGVSLDKQDARVAWLKAVRDDKLPWTQVSSLQGFESKPAVLYGVKSIPMNFLLDPSGKIIAKSLHGEALANKLAQLFPGFQKINTIVNCFNKISMTKSIGIMMIFAAMFYNGAFSQNGARQRDTLMRYYSGLAASPDEADKALLRSKMYTLLQSDNEKDWLTAMRFFYQLKMSATMDSVNAADKLKFPAGEVVRNGEVKKVYDAKGGKEKEAAYKEWIGKFPPEKFGTDRIQYDYARQAVAREYAGEDNVPKAMEYVALLETRAWKGEGGAGVAYTLIEKGRLAEAAILLKKAIDNSRDFMTVHKDDDGARFAASGYLSYCSKYAEVLYKQKNYPEALEYIKIAYDSTKQLKAATNETYAEILMAMGKDKAAFDKIDEAVKAGQANAAMKENLKKLYVKVKGSDKGYDDYMADVNRQLTAKFMRELPKEMLNLPAPDFTLQDLNGNTVTLAGLKGKTVVVDFWATWCGPCKASFPAMQMAVNKYRDSGNVKFVFIHTWEHEDNPTDLARRYITDMKYSFQVLMDLKDKTTGLNKVVDNFKVTGIPTKFVIDKNGHIRFRLTGFSGGNDAAVEELTAMIRLAEKS